MANPSHGCKKFEQLRDKENKTAAPAQGAAVHWPIRCSIDKGGFA
jgi:hypothetical protein